MKPNDDKGGDEMDESGRPEILQHKRYFDPEKEPFEKSQYLLFYKIVIHMQRKLYKKNNRTIDYKTFYK